MDKRISFGKKPNGTRVNNSKIVLSQLYNIQVEDVKPVGFRRLVQFTYTSRCMSWKVDEPEEWWHILEAANKYLNTR